MMEEVVRLIKDKKLEFPYKRYFISIDEIKANFEELKSYRYSVSTKPFTVGHLPQAKAADLVFVDGKGKSYPLVLKCKVEDYFKYDIISDYFQEEARMRAKRYDAECSPYDFWLQHPEKILAHALHRTQKVDHNRAKYTKTSAGLIDLLTDKSIRIKACERLLKLTPYELRESVYELKASGEATQFRPTLMVEFIREFNRHRVLDMCSGWGDRLIGAMAANVDFYCGVDPYSSLHPNYDKIIRTFLPLMPHKVQRDKFTESSPNLPRFCMIRAPFEKALIPSVPYDMIFTSPPYFDLEVYCDEETQSHKLGSLNRWYNDFLIFSLRKAWSYLQTGGLCCIVINDMKGKPDFTMRMVNDVGKFPNAHSKGVIGYLAPKKRHPQPVWIWKKG